MDYYNGYYVFNEMPDKEMQFTFHEPYKFIGANYTTRDSYVLSKSTLTITGEYDQVNLTERNKFFYLFNDKAKGRLNNFYLRTFVCNLEVVEDISSSATSIYVKNTDMDKRYLSLVNNVHLYKEGASHIPQIITVDKAADPSKEIIGINTGFGITIPAGSYLEFVFFVRLDQDTLAFDMTDIHYSKCTLKFKTANKV